jgi:hypothetical protein
MLPTVFRCSHLQVIDLASVVGIGGHLVPAPHARVYKVAYSKLMPQALNDKVVSILGVVIFSGTCEPAFN